MFQAKSSAPVSPSLKKESQVLVVNGIIMVSRAHNMCKPGRDPIDCKSSALYEMNVKSEVFMNLKFKLIPLS